MRRILFVCAENAGRSQMAEAFFNYLAAGAEIVAESAGTLPAPAVNRVVVAAMQEGDINISTNKPKQFNPDTADQYDRLISFGCLVRSAFPPDIQARIEDWDVADPRGKELPEVREIRDAIKYKVRGLLAEFQS